MIGVTQVLINGLYTADNNQSINFDRPVKAVAIDPKFSKHGSGKSFVTGDDKVRERERDRQTEKDRQTERDRQRECVSEKRERERERGEMRERGGE